MKVRLVSARLDEHLAQPTDAASHGQPETTNHDPGEPARWMRDEGHLP